jgi:hypothetical protein
VEEALKNTKSELRDEKKRVLHLTSSLSGHLSLFPISILTSPRDEKESEKVPREGSHPSRPEDQEFGRLSKKCRTSS